MVVPDDCAPRRSRVIGVALSKVRTSAPSDTRVETRFDPACASAGLRDTMHKTPVRDRVGGERKIVGESNR